MESCIENNLSNLPDKCKNLLSDIKDVIEIYPFMKDVISKYINSWSFQSTKIKTLSCTKSLAEIQSVKTNNYKNKIKMCRMVANKTGFAKECVSKSPIIDEKLSMIPVVLLKRLSCTYFPFNDIKCNGMKRSANCAIKSQVFSKNTITNDANISGNHLDRSEKLSSDLLEKPITETCSFPEARSTNLIVTDKMPLSSKEVTTKDQVGLLCSNVYESSNNKDNKVELLCSNVNDNNEEEKREECFDSTMNTESDDELDAISLYTNSLSGSDAEEDDCIKKSDNNIVGDCDTVAVKHADERLAAQQPELQIKCVDAVVQQNINNGRLNSTNNVCDEPSQLNTIKNVIIGKDVETLPKKLNSVENNKAKRTGQFDKNRPIRIKRQPSTSQGCYSARINKNFQISLFSEHCLTLMSTGICKSKKCFFSHQLPVLSHDNVEDWIKLVSFAKQKNLSHLLDHTLPKLVVMTATLNNFEYSYDIILKVLEICDYTGNKAVDFILNTLHPLEDNLITKDFMDILLETIMKCDVSVNTWIKFIHFTVNKVYIVPINVISKILNLCIDSAHKVMCSTVFEVFFQPPKYDLKMFPSELIRRFADTLLNLKVHGDISYLTLRREDSSESLQTKSSNHVESCGLENDKIVNSPADILSPKRMKFFKEMSEHFSSELCNIDSLLPELVSVSENSELQEYYHILFRLKEDFKNKNFDNFIEILTNLQKIKHDLEIAREVYVMWKFVHASNSQPFYDLVTSVKDRRNEVGFMELILTTIGVNIMLEKYFQSTWRDAYGICKALLDNCLNPVSAQVNHKKIISPCNVVLISCEICMSVNDWKNAVNLIKENGFMASSGWSVKEVEGDVMMKTDVCQKLLELLILRNQYNIASWMMWRLWNTQPYCFDPIDLRKYCSPLICGLVSQKMGSEAEKLFLLSKKDVKYEKNTIRLLVVDAISRRKMMFARDVYAAGISFNVYPPIMVVKPVSTNILSFWTAEEIQISLIIFFEKVAEFFKECDDVNEFNVVIYITKVDANIDTMPACFKLLENDGNCHTTKQAIENILRTKLIRPISWIPSTQRAIYLDKHSVFLYVKTFFLESLY